MRLKTSAGVRKVTGASSVALKAQSILRNFGAEVSTCVDCLTDDTNSWSRDHNEEDRTYGMFHDFRA